MSPNFNVLDHLMDLNKIPLPFNDVILKLSGTNVIPFQSLPEYHQFLPSFIDSINQVVIDFNSQRISDKKSQALNNILKDLVEEKLRLKPETTQTHKFKRNGYPHIDILFHDTHIFLSLTATSEISTDKFRALYIYPADSEEDFRVQFDGIHLRMKFEYSLNPSNENIINSWAVIDLHGLNLMTKMEFNASNSDCFTSPRIIYQS